jgi:hypothetical protein
MIRRNNRPGDRRPSGFPGKRPDAFHSELGLNGLGRVAVSGVVCGLGFLVVFFEAQMIGQLALEERFDNLLADLPHERVKIIEGFNALLLKQLFQFVSVKSHRNLLDSFYSFKEVYTVFLKEEVESAIKKGKEAVESNDDARISSELENLGKVSNKLSTEMYKNASAQAEQPGAAGQSEANPAADPGAKDASKEDEVIDAEFEDLGKNKK